MRYFLFFILLSYNIDLSGQSLWQKNFSAANQSLGEGHSCLLADGSYVIAGRCGLKLLVYKVNRSGDTTWTKTFWAGNSSSANDIKQTSDGGFIITGSVFENGHDDLLLVRIDIAGNLTWEKRYGSTVNIVGNSVCQTSDGGFITAGFTHLLSNMGWSNIYLLRTDLNGDTLWTRIIKDTMGILTAWSIRPADGNNWIIDATGGEGMGILKVDSNGYVAETNSFRYGSTSSGSMAIRSLDGGYLICGHMMDTYLQMDFSLVKIDSALNFQWARTVGGQYFDHAYSVIQCPDSSILIGGTYDAFHSSGSMKALLVKFSSQGDTLWTRSYHFKQYTSFKSMQLAGDSLLYILCSANDSGGYVGDFIIVIDPNSNSVGDCNLDTVTLLSDSPVPIQSNISSNNFSSQISVTTPFGFVGSGLIDSSICQFTLVDDKFKSDKITVSIYPNPTSVFFKINNASSSQIIIYSIIGDELSSRELKSNSETISIESLPPGIYFVQIKTANGISVQKLIKQ